MCFLDCVKLPVISSWGTVFCLSLLLVYINENLTHEWSKDDLTRIEFNLLHNSYCQVSLLDLAINYVYLEVLLKGINL